MLGKLKWSKLAVISFCLMGVVEAQPNKTILWGFADDQDEQAIRRAEQVGIATDTNLLLIELLRKKYAVEYHFVKPDKGTRLLKTVANFCLTNRIKTSSRARHHQFSLPLNLYPGLRLYFAKQDRIPALLLNDKSQLTSLIDLFNTMSDKVLVLNQGRSLGDVLDRQVVVLNKNNLNIRGAVDKNTSTILMLGKNRSNYLIEFPVDVNNVLTKHDKAPELQSVSIAGAPPYILGHVACTKTDVGRAIVEDINTALLKLYEMPEFYQAHTRYLSQTDIPAFDKNFEQVFDWFVGQ